MVKIKSVRIKWIYDEYPDVSWLDRTAEDHYGKDGSNWDHVSDTDKAVTVEKYGSLMAACEHYARQDQERLQAFYDGEWHMAGCVARATVAYTQKGFSVYIGRREEFSSGGLWGIESDSDDGYREEVEKEQLANLKEHLEQFGVDTSDFYEIYEEEQNG